MEELLVQLAIICPLVFAAAFIDAVAGGGGLISLPAYLLAGLPPHTALGTNKVVSSVGTLMAAAQYIRKGKANMLIAAFSALGCIAGAWLGSTLVLYIDESVLNIVLLVILPVVAVFLVTRKDLGSESVSELEMIKSKMAILSVLIGFCIGFYDGLIGPGTGTFLILAFSAVFKINLVTASGCAKVSNFASNITSAIVFLFAGEVLYAVIFPAMLCSVAGGFSGAKYAIKGGSKKIRKFIFVVIALLFVKFFIDLI